MTNPLTIAAAQAVGPITPGQENEWFERVKQIATDLAIINTDIDRRISLIEKISLGSKPENGGTKGWGIVRGTITEVEYNSRQQRTHITYSAYDPANDSMGLESIRTPAAFEPDGPELAATAQRLVGHRVALYKQQVSTNDGSGKSAKVVAHIVDEGKDATDGTPTPAPAQAPAPAPAPAPQQAPAEQQPAEATIKGVDGKRRVLAEVNNDTDAARQVWAAIGNPADDALVSISAIRNALNTRSVNA